MISIEAARVKILGGYNLVGAIGPELDDTIAVVKKHLQTSLAPLGNEPSQLI